MGHELPFAVTRNQVCNAAINRHTRPERRQFGGFRPFKRSGLNSRFVP